MSAGSFAAIRSDVLASALSRWRRDGLALTAAVGAVAVGVAVNRHEPIVEWAFFRYARAVLTACVFIVASLAVGNRLTRRLLPRALPLAERTTIAFATGVMVFYLVTSAVGFVGGFGWFSAATTPVVLFL